MSVEKIIRSREQLIQALIEEDMRYDTNQLFLPIGYFKLILVRSHYRRYAG